MISKNVRHTVTIVVEPLSQKQNAAELRDTYLQLNFPVTNWDASDKVIKNHIIILHGNVFPEGAYILFSIMESN